MPAPVSPVSPISIAWTVVSNVDDQDSFSACFRLRNVGPDLIAPGWAVYFNACRKIVPGSVTNGYAIEHVNGDLFRLGAASTLPWRPGQVLIVAYCGEFWAISATDAPLGCYLVDANGGVTDLGDPAIAPFATPRQRHRGPADATPLDDAAGRFAQNAAVHLLPREAVGRITPQPVTASFDGGMCTLSRASRIDSANGMDNEAALLRRRKRRNGRIAKVDHATVRVDQVASQRRIGFADRPELAAVCDGEQLARTPWQRAGSVKAKQVAVHMADGIAVGDGTGHDLAAGVEIQRPAWRDRARADIAQPETGAERRLVVDVRYNRPGD